MVIPKRTTKRLNSTRTYYRNGTAGPVTPAPALCMTLNSLKRMGSVIVVRFAKLVCALQIGCCGSKLLSQGHLASNAQTQPHLHGRAVLFSFLDLGLPVSCVTVFSLSRVAYWCMGGIQWK